MQTVTVPAAPGPGPFYLANSQSLALKAWTPFLATADTKITQCNIYLKNQADGKVKHLAEAAGPNGPFTFHQIELHQPCNFEWTVPSLAARNNGYTVTKLRIRLTSWIPSGLGAGELPLQGAWLVGNIVPL